MGVHFLPAVVLMLVLWWPEAGSGLVGGISLAVPPLWDL